MKRILTELSVKLIITFLFAVLSFGFSKGNTLSWIFIVALIGAVFNYLIGCFLLLPNFGNSITSISNGLLAGIIAYFVSLITVNFNIVGPTMDLFSFLVIIGEIYFYYYLLGNTEMIPEF